MNKHLSAMSEAELAHLVLHFLLDSVDDAHASHDYVEETEEARDAFVLLMDKKDRRLKDLEGALMDNAQREVWKCRNSR